MDALGEGRMEQEKVYSFLELCGKDYIFDDMIMIKDKIAKIGETWPKFTTRYGFRYVNELNFEDIEPIYVNVVHEMLELAAKTITDGSSLIPIQIFVNYYKNGNNVCPMHKHRCRQMTLSFGTDRTMRIVNKEGKKVEFTLYNGSIIYLHGQEHSIIRETGIDEDRISFNLFFTTTSERHPVNY